MRTKSALSYFGSDSEVAHSSRTVAVLCVARNSVYKQLPHVDAFDELRDARSFSGDCPIVAHPPCRAWSRFCSHQAKPIEGEKELAPFVVEILRKNGGVLEHPAHSTLWDYMGLPMPGEPERHGLWTLAVDQAWWGDRRSKRTWLLFSHIDPANVIVPLRLHDSRKDREQWNAMSKNKRAATPPAMALWLVEVARLANVKPSSAGVDSHV